MAETFFYTQAHDWNAVIYFDPSADGLTYLLSNDIVDKQCEQEPETE